MISLGALMYARAWPVAIAYWMARAAAGRVPGASRESGVFASRLMPVSLLALTSSTSYACGRGSCAYMSCIIRHQRAGDWSCLRQGRPQHRRQNRDRRTPDAPGPVKKATETSPATWKRCSASGPRIVAQASGPAIEIAAPTGGRRKALPSRRAAIMWCCRAPTCAAPSLPSTASRQDYLGVDPMYYWTDKQPAKSAVHRHPGRAVRTSSPSPLFKYRGFFINDEDQLTGWAPGEKTDHSGIAKAVMDKIFETILRLKGNMVVPGHLDLLQRSADEMGGGARPDPQPASRHPAGHECGALAGRCALQLLHPSRNAAAGLDQRGRMPMIPKQEILWSVGLRGLSDHRLQHHGSQRGGQRQAAGRS